MHRLARPGGLSVRSTRPCDDPLTWLLSAGLLVVADCCHPLLVKERNATTPMEAELM